MMRQPGRIPTEVGAGLALFGWLLLQKGRVIKMKQSHTKHLVVTAFCLALCVVLPMAFHAIGAGQAFLPMHIPVLLCGFLCGWPYGAFCGLLGPLLSSVFTGMPAFFPNMPAMMLELCAYGVLTGLLYRRMGLNLYLSLICAMLGGRAVSGAANALLLGIAGRPYGLSVFLSASFVTALPGILIQLVAVPLLVAALQRAGLVEKPRRRKILGSKC